MSDDVFSPWVERWRLLRDGPGFTTTFGNHLLPVLTDATPAMLKIAVGEEEVRGADLMVWYGGLGAAAIIALDGPALLIERANGVQNLANMVRDGRDDEATTILCHCAAQLHAPRAAQPPRSLTPLDVWFRALFAAEAREQEKFRKAAAAARDLLSDPGEVVVLHGDLHHGNVLDGGERGWLAIDPKGLIGDRTFEFANLLRNPDAETALLPGRMRRQISVVAEHARVDAIRLLRWTLAYSGLGAAWSLEDKQDATPGLAIAALAASELGL